MIKTVLFVVLVLLLSGIPMLADARSDGWCEYGNQTIDVLGYSSSTSTPVQRSYPQCAVTVYVHNGGIATIYSDNGVTPLSNPFTAQTNGYYFFYAANGTYDVQLSGTGFPTNFTRGAVSLFDYTTDMMTTDTNQTVTGIKTFSNGLLLGTGTYPPTTGSYGITSASVIFASGLSVDGTNYNQIQATGEGGGLAGDIVTVGNSKIAGAQYALEFLKTPVNPATSASDTAAIYLNTSNQFVASINGAAASQICTVGNGACPGSGSGGSANYVQYNNGSGGFAGSSKFTYNDSLGELSVIGGSSPGFITNGTFNSSATGSTLAFQAGGGTATVTGAGAIAGQTLALFGGLTVDNGSYGFNSSGVINAHGLAVNGTSFNSVQVTGVAGGVAADVLTVGNSFGGSAQYALEFLKTPVNPTTAAASTAAVYLNTANQLVASVNNTAASQICTAANGACSTIPGVSSIAGTSNQVIASSSTGAITLSLPQSIATTSSPQFTNLTLTGNLTIDTSYGFNGSGVMTASQAISGLYNCTSGTTAHCAQTNGSEWYVTKGGDEAGQTLTLAYGFTAGNAESGGPNLSFNAGLGQMTITGSTTAGFIAPIFNCSNTGSTHCFQTASSSAFIAGNGAIGGQSLALNTATSVVYKCTGAGTLPIGSLTTVAADCGASTATSLTLD